MTEQPLLTSEDAFTVGLFYQRDCLDSEVLLHEYEAALNGFADVMGYCFKLPVDAVPALVCSYEIEAPEAIVFNENGDVIEREYHPGREWFAYWIDEVCENRCHACG